MQKQRAYIVLILALVVAAIAILWKIPPEQGLDLIGGSQLTIQVKPTEEVSEISREDLEAVKRVIENRVNEFGVSETTVQTVGDDKISVQLPGESDPETAERRLQGTAELEFKAQKQGSEGELAAESQVAQQLQLQLAILRQQELTPENIAEINKLQESIRESNEAIGNAFESVGLTGKTVEDARPQPNQTGEAWEVAISFNNEGGQKFAELTKNIAGTGRSLGIFLDNELISAPIVGAQYAETGITGGRAVISGNFNLESANDLAIQIRGGSLPFPVEIVENRTVGATLGQDSINRSKIAGIAGLVLVLIFMGIYYRK